MTVRFEGRALFSWTGDEELIRNLEREVRQAAAGASIAQDVFAANAVMELPRTGRLAECPKEQMRLMKIIFFILSQNTGRSDRPGKFRDYLPAWDFEFDLHVAGKAISIDVTGGSWI